MKTIKNYKELCNKTNAEQILSVEYILDSGYWIKGRIEKCSNMNCPHIYDCNVYKDLDNQIPYGY